MARVAFATTDELAADSLVVQHVKKRLGLLQRSDVSPIALLSEMAHWFGSLIPMADDKWTFSHCTMHHFLTITGKPRQSHLPSDGANWTPQSNIARLCHLTDSR
jgi:hypothetical protein